MLCSLYLSDVSSTGCCFVPPLHGLDGTLTVLHVASIEQRTPSCAFDPGVAVDNFLQLHKEIRNSTETVCGENRNLQHLGIFWDLQIRKREKRSVLFILVSVKEIISDTSELVSDTGRFSESVPWTAEASNDHQFRVADANKVKQR